jgi:hypothetical protein
MEVAKGRVFPQKTKLCSQPVLEHYVVVHIDYVYPKHEDKPLSLHPSPEVRTLGQALYKRVQWRRGHLVVSPNMISSTKSRPPKPGSSKSHLKDHVLGNEKVKSASKSATTVEKPMSGTIVKRVLQRRLWQRRSQLRP